MSNNHAPIAPILRTLPARLAAVPDPVTRIRIRRLWITGRLLRAMAVLDEVAPVDGSVN